MLSSSIWAVTKAVIWCTFTVGSTEAYVLVLPFRAIHEWTHRFINFDILCRILFRLVEEGLVTHCCQCLSTGRSWQGAPEGISARGRSQTWCWFFRGLHGEASRAGPYARAAPKAQPVSRHQCISYSRFPATSNRYWKHRYIKCLV